MSNNKKLSGAKNGNEKYTIKAYYYDLWRLGLRSNVVVTWKLNGLHIKVNGLGWNVG